MSLCIALLGLVLLFVFPIGTLVGIVLIIVAIKIGSGKKVWKCKDCGYFFERD
jgi:hypothetical protein